MTPSIRSCPDRRPMHRSRGLPVALRVKGETVEEITGGARALAEKANRIHPKVDFCVDPVGTGGDGTNTFNISSTAAIVAAAAGAWSPNTATGRCRAVREAPISMNQSASTSPSPRPPSSARSKRSASASCSRRRFIRRCVCRSGPKTAGGPQHLQYLRAAVQSGRRQGPGSRRL